jgi:hypothetical protein
MSWIGGASLANGVWEIVRKRISKSKRQEVAEELFELFESHDCEIDETLLHESAYPEENDEDNSLYLDSYSDEFPDEEDTDD